MIRMLKKPDEQKNVLIKRILRFNDCENCLFKNEIILKSQKIFISEAHCVYNEEILIQDCTK